jgi:glycine hydroxymethyltransferase
MIEEILSLVKEHEDWRGKQCLNLIPSENVMSPAARSLLASDLAHRYTARDSFYMGTKFTDEIEQYGEKLACDLFKSETADLRPLSGHIADLIVLSNLTKPNEQILCLAPENGGYPGMWKEGLSGLLNLVPEAFPFSEKEWNIDVEKTKNTIQSVKPRMIIFGGSLIIFPHPVKELSEVAQDTGVTVGFDGSHVLGLIAGKQFQDPLHEGAKLLFGSTHKSFFGPQGGIILADEEHGKLLKSRIYPAYVDNAHWNRIAALTLALAEMKKFGADYGRQVVLNSQTLAKTLHDYGFPVRCPHIGFTKSHQTILDYGTLEKGRTVAQKLQRANIIVDCAVRLGTCEVTRRGMKDAEMKKIAELIKRCILDNESTETVKKDVAKMVSEYQTVEYCFKT